MAYTGIQETSLTGCGLTNHVQLILIGIVENLTIKGDVRIAYTCVLGQRDINGMIYHVVALTLTLMFAKAGVSQGASCYILCNLMLNLFISFFFL